MLKEFCEKVIYLLHDSQASAFKKIVSGKAEDFATYKYCAGILQGHKEAEEAIRAVYEEFTEPKKILKAKMGE
jgi:hypothetical protein